jgi:hypothetical protein
MKKKRQLPTTLSADEAEIITIVEGWIDVVHDKMTTKASRAVLEAGLCDHLKRGLVEIPDAVAWADAGCEIADAALCRLYIDMRDRREETTVTLEAYALKALRRRQPLPRKPGLMWFDNWTRNVAIAVLVHMTQIRFEIVATQNREHRRQPKPSATSIVAAALGRHKINITEKTVGNIWSGLRDQLPEIWITA